MTQLETATPETSPKPKPADSAAEPDTNVSSNASNASNASSPGGSGTEKPVRRKLKRTKISQKEKKGDTQISLKPKPADSGAEPETTTSSNASNASSPGGSEADKPVRRKLRNTKIDADAVKTETNGEAKESTDDLPTTTVRGRRLRKRSHDDILEEDNNNATTPVTPSAGEHIRKKSRDVKSASPLKADEPSDTVASVDEGTPNKKAKKEAAKSTSATAPKPVDDAAVQRTPSLSPRQQETTKASPKRKREDDENEDDVEETKDNGLEKRIIKNRRLSDEKKEKKVKDKEIAKTDEASKSESVEQVAETKTDEPVNGSDIAQTEKPEAAAVKDNGLQASAPATEITNTPIEPVEKAAETKTDEPVTGDGVSAPTEKAEVAEVTKSDMQAPEPASETTKPEEATIPESSTQADAATEKPAPKFSFGNTSTMSPFGSLGASKPAEQAKPEKEPATTSASAFASSGFAKLANSSSPFAGAGTTNVFGGSTTSASPFGGLSSTTPSVFGVAAKDTTTATSTASPFATAGASVFGSGFSSGFGSGPKLTSFASPNVPPARESEKKQKAFGEPDSAGEEEDGEEGDDEEGGEGEQAEGDENKEGETAAENESEDAPRKSAPKEVLVDTGEEDEDIVISLNGKLFEFAFTTRKWAERGSGTLKINTRVEIGEDDNDKVHARIIMRARATHKVLLNAPIFKGMKATANGKQVTFSVPAEGGKSLVPHLFRMGNEENAKSLETALDDIQVEL